MNGRIEARIQLDKLEMYANVLVEGMAASAKETTSRMVYFTARLRHIAKHTDHSMYDGMMDDFMHVYSIMDVYRECLLAYTQYYYFRHGYG